MHYFDYQIALLEIYVNTAKVQKTGMKRQVELSKHELAKSH